MYCNQCGKEIADDARFCTSCGFQINNMGSIIFARENQFYGSVVPIKIFMDGQLVATVNSGREVKVPATIGNHKVAFNLWSGNGQFDIEVPANHPDIKVTFKLGVGAVTSKPKILSITNV